MSSRTVDDGYTWCVRAHSDSGPVVRPSPVGPVRPRGERASALIDEAGAVHLAAGGGPYLSTSLVLAAWRGQEALVSDLADTIVEDAPAAAERRAVCLAEYAKALLYNGLGHYRAAVTAAHRAYTDAPDGLLAWVLTELVEGAVRDGDLDLAARASRRLREGSPAAGTDWVLGVQARSDALLGGHENAAALFRECIERLTAARIPLHVARAQLVYGEWLRREGRRVQAREHLRTAQRTFADLDLRGYAERAQRELLATGERVRRRSVETRADLTPQEAEIARLASAGDTNPEIGAHLFLSPRTVEWHLKKVFTKLGISSRRQLRTALTDARPTAVPA
jgi:DNA-binding CsgD family transcriptional regulator